MCALILLVLLGPRIIAIFWWLADQTRWDNAFDTVAWPVLGVLVLPWTTMAFVGVAPSGTATGIDWLWLGLAFIADVGSFGSGGLRRR